MQLSASDELVVFTRERMASVAKISVRELDYLHRSHLQEASVDIQLSATRTVRQYSFSDALSVLIIRQLEERRISKRYIREILSYLRSQDYRPSELRWAIAGKRVHIQTPDGLWSDAERPQGLLPEVLDLRPLRQVLRRAGRRRKSEQGHVETRAGVMGRLPVLVGTRIPVAAVRQYLDSGHSDETIIAAYPSLSAADIDAVRRLAS